MSCVNILCTVQAHLSPNNVLVRVFIVHFWYMVADYIDNMHFQFAPIKVTINDKRFLISTVGRREGSYIFVEFTANCPAQVFFCRVDSSAYRICKQTVVIWNASHCCEGYHSNVIWIYYNVCMCMVVRASGRLVYLLEYTDHKLS